MLALTYPLRYHFFLLLLNLTQKIILSVINITFRRLCLLQSTRRSINSILIPFFLSKETTINHQLTQTMALQNANSCFQLWMVWCYDLLLDLKPKNFIGGARQRQFKAKNKSNNLTYFAQTLSLWYKKKLVFYILYISSNLLNI